MVWVPLAAAAFVLFAVIGIHFVQERRAQASSRVYRARFVQLVSQLDSMAYSLNHLENHVEHIQDVKALEYYEKTLLMMETLLGAITKLAPFGTVPSDLNAALSLTKDCRERVIRSQKAFRQILRGRGKDVEKILSDNKPGLKATGCYFCSRPVVANRYSKVKVRLDGSVKQVMSCAICRTELETTKKVKVLYFMQDGQPVHWSLMKDYKPSEDFWNINKRQVVRQERKLELVYSQQDKKPLKDEDS